MQVSPMARTGARVGLAVAAPLVFFGLLEGIFFLTGLFDPVPVLKKTAHGGREYWTSEADYGPFALRRPDAPRPHHVWMPVEKASGEFRVVMLGESAVAGFPSEEYSLGRLTAAVWNGSHPNRPMSMATVAMVGVNSHALRQFALEAMKLRPDALVLYAGHNEVIGPYGPASKPLGGFSHLWLARAGMALRNTHTGRALESVLGSLGGLFQDDADRWKGLDEHGDSYFDADDPALDRMLEQTRANFRDILTIATRHNCKVLVCVPAVNLTDWPPMASAEESEKSARLEYDLAQEAERAGRMDEAWKHYRRACDLDRLRFRADSRIRQVQRDLVADKASPDVALVDADFWLHEWNPRFSGDREYFLEHVHLSFEGRLAVAALIADGLAELVGESPAEGVGRVGFAGVADWWGRLPARIQAAKERVLFTELDDAYLWQSAADLLAMKVFAGMSDIDERRRALEARASALRDEGRAKWTAAEIEAAHRKASALEPGDGWIDLKASENLANVIAFEAGRKYLKAASEKLPRLVQVHTALAHQAMRDRLPAVALRHLQELEALLPEGAGPVELFAVAHLVSGNPQAAIPYLERVAALSASKPEAWIELARAQVASGRRKAAIATCRRGLELAGPNAELQTMLSKLESGQ